MQVHRPWYWIQCMSDLFTSPKTQLNDQTLLARGHEPQRMSSSAIQMKLPIWVAVFAVGPFTSLPKPKSAILTLLSVVMSKFGVFKSRCATHCSCNQERPAVTASIAFLQLQSYLINHFEAHTSSAVTARQYLSNAWSPIWAQASFMPLVVMTLVMHLAACKLGSSR